MPVHSYTTHIELSGTCTYPETREGHAFEFSIYSGTRHEGETKLKVEDYRIFDDDHNPVQKKARGQYLYVHKLPSGIGYIEKQRGENAWHAALFIERQATSDMLALLGSVEPLYISLHEMKQGRRRSIVGFTLQTTDPAEE